MIGGRAYRVRAYGRGGTPVEGNFCTFTTLRRYECGDSYKALRTHSVKTFNDGHFRPFSSHVGVTEYNGHGE